MLVMFDGIRHRFIRRRYQNLGILNPFHGGTSRFDSVQYSLVAQVTISPARHSFNRGGQHE